MYFLSYTIEFKEFSKGSTIFREGDIGELFYLIFQGEVDVLQIEYKCEFYTYPEYFSILEELFLKDDLLMLKSILERNSKKIPIVIEDIKYLDEISFVIELRRLISLPNSLNNILNFFNTSKRIPEEYGFSFNKSKMSDKFMDYSRKFEIKSPILPKSVRIDGLYGALFSVTTSFPLEIGFYVKKFSLSEGHYFGDFALDSKHKIRLLIIYILNVDQRRLLQLSHAFSDR